VNGQCGGPPTVQLSWLNQTPATQIYIRQGNAYLTLKGTVTAMGTPLGGTFSWTTQPGGVVGINGSSDTVTLQGLTTGTANLTVQYTPPNGQPVKAQAVVKVFSPFILVHGFNSNAQMAWGNLISELQTSFNLAYDNTLVNLPDSNCRNLLTQSDVDFCAVDFQTDSSVPYRNQGDFGIQGDSLALAVLSLKQVTGSNNVTLLAHSMGGLASRAALQSRGGTLPVDKLITVGTPNLGSPWISLLAGGIDLSGMIAGLNNIFLHADPTSPAVQALQPGSPQLVQLNSQAASLPQNVSYVSIIGIDSATGLLGTTALSNYYAAITGAVCVLPLSQGCQLLHQYNPVIAALLPQSDGLVSVQSQDLTLVTPLAHLVQTIGNVFHTSETDQIQTFLPYLGLQ
jgi:pimeloyl-ACP methyl ester carboxylesterase